MGLLAAVLRVSHPMLPRQRPNATRTVAVDTPVSAPIAARVHPCCCSSRIRATTSSVSLNGPVGPRLPGTSPATPSAANSHRQRHKVLHVTANPDATWEGRAISVSTSCTAANRRPTSSSASKQNVASPLTYTTDPPSGSATSAAIGPIGVAPAGVSGNTGWVTAAIRWTTSIRDKSSHEQSHKPQSNPANDTPRNRRLPGKTPNSSAGSRLYVGSPGAGDRAPGRATLEPPVQ